MIVSTADHACSNWLFALTAHRSKPIFWDSGILSAETLSNLVTDLSKSSKNAEIPSTKPVRPQDLMATIFKHFNIDENLQYIDKGGRPVYMIEDGTPIPELG